jgi:hypothetical protein
MELLELLLQVEWCIIFNQILTFAFSSHFPHFLGVGLYARWGGGKSTLWKLTRRNLHAEYLRDDVQILDEEFKTPGGEIKDSGDTALAKAYSKFNDCTIIDQGEKDAFLQVNAILLDPPTIMQWSTISVYKFFCCIYKFFCCIYKFFCCNSGIPSETY